MTLLSITVPTFNRAVLLDFFLSVHAPLFQRHGVPLYIADNASTDDTPQVCERWAAKFDVLRVYRFDDHVETDRNFHRALVLPNSRYVWLMGDGYEITEAMLVKALMLVSADSQYDHITINLSSISDFKVGKEYRSPSEVVKILAWLMTCISCNIYGERLLKKARFENFYNSSFLQCGIALDFMRFRDFRFYFSPEISVVTLKCPQYKKAAWGGYFFDVCFTRFPKLSFALHESLQIEDQLNLCRSFFLNSPVFGWRHLLNMRANGALDPRLVSKHKVVIRALSPWRFQLTLFLLILLPKLVSKPLSVIVETMRKYNYRIRKRFGLWGEGM